MTIADIVRAYEVGLITEGEAAEQGMVDDLGGLYEKFSRISQFKGIGNAALGRHVQR